MGEEVGAGEAGGREDRRPTEQQTGKDCNAGAPGPAVKGLSTTFSIWFYRVHKRAIKGFQ